MIFFTCEFSYQDADFRRYAQKNVSNYLSIEAIVKTVTPVKTGVQRYLNLFEITGFRLPPE